MDYKKTATWEGYEESLMGDRNPASVDQLLDWINQLKRMQRAEPCKKDSYENEITATKEILKLIV